MPKDWTPYAKKYDPLGAGSIDGTDTIPHDAAILRAMHATYVPPKSNMAKHRTLFVGSLLLSVREQDLLKKFSRIGKVRSCKIVRNIVTGRSCGYGFVEYDKEKDAIDAYHDLHKVEFDGKACIVDWEASRSMAGWIPRRLGGGWNGKRESGQLRFGCRSRPWSRPIILSKPSSSHSSESSTSNFSSIGRRKEHSSDTRKLYSKSQRVPSERSSSKVYDKLHH